jgi:hypothetical protein
MNTIILQLKKTSSIELISAVGSLHVDPFLLHIGVLSQSVVHVVLCAVKDLSRTQLFSLFNLSKQIN